MAQLYYPLWIRCGVHPKETVYLAVAQMYSGEFLEMHPELGGPRGTHDYNRAFVNWCYRVFLRREPDDPPDNDCAGFNFWVNKLDNANPEDEEYNYWEMVRAFIESISIGNVLIRVRVAVVILLALSLGNR